MTTSVEFVSTKEDKTTTTGTSPWSEPKANHFEDRILKPEYEAARHFRFRTGLNWFRLVPAIKGSAHGWMMPVRALNYEGGRFAHPRTLRKKARSPFDQAYAWAKQNHPGSLFSKENKQGVRLLTDPLCVCWIIVEEEGKSVARLLVASGYDGTRGGAPGLGFEIWRSAREVDENGDLVADAIDPDGGLLCCVEKVQAKGAKYPSYAVRMGRQPCPMDKQLAKMDPEEIRVLCPLENVIQDLSEEEQWQCLARCIAPETVQEIRSSLG